MNRTKAINYLEKKDEEVTDEKISEVMKKGKIYGDPSVELNY